MPDFSQIPGFGGHYGPPAQYVPDTRKWTVHHCDVAFAGGRLRSAAEYPCDAMFPCVPVTGIEGVIGPKFMPDFVELVSNHPMRAVDRFSMTTREPGVGYLQQHYHSPFDDYNPVASLFEDLPTAGGDVELKITAYGDFGHSNEYCDVYLNGGLLDRIFVSSGQAIPLPSIETLMITQERWNAETAADHTALIELNASDYVGPETNSRVYVRVEYAGPETVIEDWAYDELCFRHAGYGYQMNEAGFVVPATLIHPTEERGVFAAIGAFWACKTDHPAGLGDPGWVVAALPVQTPRAIEGIFASYPKTCGNWE